MSNSIIRLLSAPLNLAWTGPIVRISPNEVHIQDSSFYETLYHQSRPMEKPLRHYARFQNWLALFSTIYPAKHHERRAALNPFFSKRKIAAQAHTFQESMDKICHRLQREYRGTGKILRLHKMWGCFTCDNFTNYAFERHYDSVDLPDFLSPFNEATDRLYEPCHVPGQFPILIPLMNRTPDWFMEKTVPFLKPFLDFKLVRFSCSPRRLVRVTAINAPGLSRISGGRLKTIWRHAVSAAKRATASSVHS